MGTPLRERIKLEERQMMFWLIPACMALFLLIVVGGMWGGRREENQRYIEAQSACGQQGREAMVMPMTRDRDLLFCRDANGALYALPATK